MSTTSANTINFQNVIEAILKKLCSVTTGEHYNQARAELFVALNEAKKVPELQDLAIHIEAVRATNYKTFTGDITRSLLIDELENLLQEVKMKTED